MEWNGMSAYIALNRPLEYSKRSVLTGADYLGWKKDSRKRVLKGKSFKERVFMDIELCVNACKQEVCQENVSLVLLYPD